LPQDRPFREKNIMPLPNLTGKVCLVTGASRGIGRGIAMQLAKSGATVYITGRKIDDLKKAADEMKGNGAKEVIPLQVDHSNEDQIKTLFEKIKSEKSHLDVLVNNAYAAVNHITENMGKPFWEAEPAYSWDIVNNVGLRNHFICTTYAARMMSDQKSGMIVNISSAGGLRYLFNVPYGVGKAAVDRMTQDTAFELRRHNVAVVALWPGAVKTETIQANILDNENADPRSKAMFAEGETVNFAGKAVAHLAADESVMKKTGRILMTNDLASEFNFTEDDGSIPKDPFSLKSVLTLSKLTWLAAITPEFIPMPKTLLYLAGYKF